MGQEKRRQQISQQDIFQNLSNHQRDISLNPTSFFFFFFRALKIKLVFENDALGKRFDKRKASKIKKKKKSHLRRKREVKKKVKKERYQNQHFYTEFRYSI